MPDGKTAPALPLPADEIIKDYRLAYRSRQASLIGRREVLSGKAKFGIFGDGKEVVQLAMARSCLPGDWRSGYYRDQTWMFAVGTSDIHAFFAQLYAHADVNAEPATAGRAMNGHFASRFIAPDGSWLDQTAGFNVAADISPTAGQMARSVGLAYASRLYREIPELRSLTQFSRRGNEIVWVSIGNASTAEGIFWESVNAIGVLKSPAILTVYDDGYGISVPNRFQMVKENIGAILQGFERDPDLPLNGYDLYSVHGWDYPALLNTFQVASQIARTYHVPAIVHVTELTQPQGHSTSGSHERYKTPERLAWEASFDCLGKLRAYILENGIATERTLAHHERVDLQQVENLRKRAWEDYSSPIVCEKAEAVTLLKALAQAAEHVNEMTELPGRLDAVAEPLRRDIAAALHEALVLTRDTDSQPRQELAAFAARLQSASAERYGSHLYSQSPDSMLAIPDVKPLYSPRSPTVMAFEVINACFDAAFARDPRIIAFGEDVGKLGDVNQGFRGMQEKYGPLRVSDTGIREATILGQAIGLAMRGLRPICEIQYLDYLLYALQLMADDLANLNWRTAGGQKAPVIIRTRGHRLEGIWHSGSPMAGIINLVHGMVVLVPRNLTQAAGFYNMLLQADEPALVVEVLNGYRLKERLPDNVGKYTVLPGLPEVLRDGSDVTLVTYGACCRIALEAAGRLAKTGIEVEVIDVQSLLPFDLHGCILESLKKTGRILFVDEDVPGGTTAYMLQEVIEKQGGYFWLDAPPRTLPGAEHRPVYGSDGDYWSKPNAESIFDAVYDIMYEVDPARFPKIK